MEIGRVIENGVQEGVLELVHSVGSSRVRWIWSLPIGRCLTAMRTQSRVSGPRTRLTSLSTLSRYASIGSMVLMECFLGY